MGDIPVPSGHEEACRCGCVPPGMMSMFQMADLRAERRKEEMQFQEIILSRVVSVDSSYVSMALNDLNLGRIFLNSFTFVASSLVTLHLDHNNFKEIPFGLFSIVHNLRDLALHNNVLMALPSDIGKLQQLQELRVDNNILMSLPTELGDCKQLTLLHLDGNKNLSEIPNSIGDLPTLHHILMVDTGVTRLPMSMHRCLSLEFIVFDEESWIEPPVEVMFGGGDAIRQYLISTSHETQTTRTQDSNNSKNIS